MADSIQLPDCIIGQLIPQQPCPRLAFFGARSHIILPAPQQPPFAAQQVAPFLPHCICFLAFMLQQRSPGFALLAIMGHCIGWASFCDVVTQQGHAAGVFVCSCC